jgi:hypothetical protein
MIYSPMFIREKRFKIYARHCRKQKKRYMKIKKHPNDSSIFPFFLLSFCLSSLRWHHQQFEFSCLHFFAFCSSSVYSFVCIQLYFLCSFAPSTIHNICSRHFTLIRRMTTSLMYPNWISGNEIRFRLSTFYATTWRERERNFHLNTTDNRHSFN